MVYSLNMALLARKWLDQLIMIGPLDNKTESWPPEGVVGLQRGRLLQQGVNLPADNREVPFQTYKRDELTQKAS